MKNGRLMLLGIVCLAFTSCGLFDIDVDEMADVATAFQLDRDTVYLLQDENYVFSPLFEPDSVASRQVFYQSLGDTVAVMKSDTVVGVAPGWAMIMATSVSARLVDSCMVCVLEEWTPTELVYPYETIVYAEVTVKDRPMDDDMIVAAFCADEVRGIGSIVEQHGRRYMLFRVGSIINNQEEEDDDDAEVQHERISFRCYDKKTHQLYYGSQSVDFDEETHGRPTAPIRLKF